MATIAKPIIFLEGIVPSLGIPTAFTADPATDRITLVSVGGETIPDWKDDTQVLSYSTGNLPDPVAQGQYYWLAERSGNSYKLADAPASAQSAPLALNTTGSGRHYAASVNGVTQTTLPINVLMIFPIEHPKQIGTPPANVKPPEWQSSQLGYYASQLVADPDKTLLDNGEAGFGIKTFRLPVPESNVEQLIEDYYRMEQITFDMSYELRFGNMGREFSVSSQRVKELRERPLHR